MRLRARRFLRFPFNPYQNVPVIHLYWINGEILTDRCTLCFSSAIVETAIVLRAFYDVVDYKSAGQMDPLVSTEAVRGVIHILRRPVDGKSSPSEVKANHAFQLNVVSAACDDPHCVALVCISGHRHWIEGERIDFQEGETTAQHQQEGSV